jgi:uncharacterized membrane protein
MIRISRQTFKSPAVWVVVAITLYIGFMTWVGWLKFNNLAFFDFDLAIHAQSVWSILQFSGESSILGIPFLGNHAVFILYLVAPLYAVFSTPVLLLTLQSCVLGFGGWAAFRLASKLLHPAWGAFLAIAYLANPSLWMMNLYEFHPVALATTFLLFALVAFEEERFWPFVGAWILALACQENLSLIAIAFSAYAFFRGRRRGWVFFPLAAGILHFGLTVGLLLPRLNDRVDFYSLYGHIGSSPGAIISPLLLHPLKWMAFMLGENQRGFLVDLLGPLGFTALFSPLSLLPDFFVFFQRLLSQRASETAMGHHYQAEFLPCVFFASVHGIRFFLKLPFARAKEAVVILICLGTALTALGNDAISKITKRHLAFPLNDPGLRKEVVQRIPDEAAVLSTMDGLSHLAHRKNLYSLHHVFWGRYTLSTQPYQLPTAVDFIYLNQMDPSTFVDFYNPGGFENLQRVVQGDWQILAQANHVLLLKRGAGPRPAGELLQSVPALPNGARPPAQVQFHPQSQAQGNLQIEAFSFRKVGTDLLEVDLFWRRLASSAVDIHVALQVVDKAGQVKSSAVLNPGNRIWPAQSWPVGMLMRDRHRMVFSGAGESPDQLQLRVVVLPRRAMPKS